MTKQKTTKKQRLLNYLSTGKKVTKQQAFTRFGTKNLRADINTLRNEGYNITTVKVTKNSNKSAYVMG